MLACRTYCSGTIGVNKKYLLEGIYKPGRMIHGAYKSYQDGSPNLVATVWKDNRIVRCVSTNSNPRNINTDRRLGHNEIQVNQQQNIQLYNRYMNGIDCYEQMCMKYDVGCFSVKTWKYTLWYFMNMSIVNAYILYCKIQQGKPKRSMLILTFDLKLQWEWLLDFHLEKGRQKLYCTLDLWQLQMEITMKMSTWAQRRERDINGTVCSKWGKKMYKGVAFTMYTCV